MRKIYLSVLAILWILPSISQNISEETKPCFTTEMQEKLFHERPELYQNYLKNENILNNAVEELPAEMRSGSILRIPIVFHVIHYFGQENISDLQIYNAVDVLNEQMRLMNENAADIHPEFIDLAADIEIEFVLARKDPQGNCTKGINRIVSELTYQGEQEMKDLIQWPRHKYLNVWICNYAAGAAGYTYLPASVDDAPSYDGIVLKYDYVGAIGTSTPTRSVALTHEVGHWLNLRHTWGSGNSVGVDCGNDLVSDTPQTIGWSSCNLNGTSCGSLDNIENYMEYTYCCKMFTQGQKQRMRAAANSSVSNRNNLWSNSNLISTGVINGDVVCEVEIEADYTSVCYGDTAYFHDISYHGVQDRQWSFPGGVPSTSNEENPKVYYAEPGTYDITLTVSDGFNTIQKTFENYIEIFPSIGDQLPFQEGFEGGVADFEEEWNVVNLDDEEGWELTNQAAHSGSTSIWLNNRYSSAGQIDEFISGMIDISAIEDIEISWKYAYAKRFSSDNEKLKFYISKDCGELWSLRKTVQGDDFPTGPNTNANWFPDEDEWNEVTTSNVLSNFYVPNFQFKFSFEADGGNNIFIDDININDTYVGIASISDEEYQFRVFPNPSSNLFTVNFELEENEDIQFRIIDLSGKLISQERFINAEIGLNTIEIQADEWANGIYLFELYTQKGIIAEKLIKY